MEQDSRVNYAFSNIYFHFVIPTPFDKFVAMRPKINDIEYK